DDRQVFFGRATESKALSQLIIASRLVVLFSKSGLGKTSLLNAGVYPVLRAEAFIPVRVRVSPGVDPVRLVSSAIRTAAVGHTTECVLPDATSLWALFKTATIWR